jgi:hypothetical protein
MKNTEGKEVKEKYTKMFLKIKKENLLFYT